MRQVKNIMKTKFLFFLGIPLLLIFLIAPSFSAEASPAAQIGVFQTPTPGPDGRIIYTVREGDSCQRIALLHGIDINQLRSLNPELDENCVVIIGQKLMVGIGGPAAAPTFTPGPSPTPTEILPTPTFSAGTTEICVILFEDVNGDGLRQESEQGLAGGAISVTNALGGYSQTKNSTAEIDPATGEPAYLCFGEKPPGADQVPESEKLPEGEYTVSAAIPDGYNPTLNLNYTINVSAGERAYIAFGAQSQKNVLDEPVEEKNSSPFLGVLGGFLLLGGGGLTWYALRNNKSTPKLKYP
jgi:hypothetical protein